MSLLLLICITNFRIISSPFVAYILYLVVWISRLRVIAELRHGDLFHSANIVSRCVEMHAILFNYNYFFNSQGQKTFLDVTLFAVVELLICIHHINCTSVNNEQTVELSISHIFLQYRIWSRWWIVCYCWSFTADQSFWVFLCKGCTTYAAFR